VTEDGVPHHLPGENANLKEAAGWYGLPIEVTRGGAEKMSPSIARRSAARDAAAANVRAVLQLFRILGLPLAAERRARVYALCRYV